MALKENNKAYIRVIQEEHTRPSRPDFLDITEEAIRQLAIIKVGGNADLVTDLVIRELAKERQHENTRLRADWQKEMDKWDTCNTRAEIECGIGIKVRTTLIDLEQCFFEAAYVVLGIVTFVLEGTKDFKSLEIGLPGWSTVFSLEDLIGDKISIPTNLDDSKLSYSFFCDIKEVRPGRTSMFLLNDTNFGYTVKRVHGDDATEHKPLATYLASKGTVWDPTPPYTKQLNGVAEIKNRHLVEPLVAVMTECQLPKYLWGLLLGEKRNTKLDPHMEEARLIAYDEGDNYVLYNVRTKKIERSRNVIFNENPTPATLPDPAYDLNITGPSTQAQDQGSSIITDRHDPVDFLNEYDYCTVPTQYYDNTGFGNKKQIQPRPSSPYRYRFSTPPPPTVEDDHEEHLDMPTNLPLDHIHPFILEEQAPVILPDPDTFVLPNDDEMAGSFGRYGGTTGGHWCPL
ncbi:Retrovirus-related Pol polyprotein from transposon TNT 1-94 [Penicillium digitatum]|uniref:Retrovirus-related Pol polyprotein from transposon TNT 1-94 n=1 Tax=Penicillium digitatum TaxID=36651 RepID=A0A7T6XPP2_PENDI|nr:Retrovirus-related Pol polyprotein from transposon TNT 1-94 [Penicillium digitatum]